ADVALKLTTAKYYVPSGRCIQKPERSKKHPESVTGLDTSDDDEIGADKEVFYTNGGRIVYGGGGIVPDITVEREKYEPIEINLERQSMFFNFAVEYTSKHQDVTRDIEITDEIFEGFRKYCEEEDFDYKSQLELSLERFEETVSDAEKTELFEEDIEEIRALIEAEKERDFDKSSDYIRRSIKREIIRKQFGERGVYEELVLQTDPYVKKALEVLRKDDEYSKQLEPGKKLSGEG
ncbi:MAG: hypothetical protein KAT85_09200, partial [candidate division Zixibacteria bacterium]|nr:hypothetical protein [candidate division Zixibacteria bacterium]